MKESILRLKLTGFLFLFLAFQPLFAESPPFPPEIESSVSHKVDYSRWYQQAANLLGVDVAYLSTSEQSLAQIAKATGFRPSKLVNSIYSAEIVSLRDYVKNGILPRDKFNRMERQLLDLIRRFIRFKPDALTTDATRQRILWDRWRVTNYEFDLRRVSFAFSEDFSYRVSLFNDQVRRVVGNDTGKIYDQATNSHLFRTVEDYFDIITAAEKDQVYSLNIHYDPVFGFPSNISIGLHPMIQDGGISYMIMNYTLSTGCNNHPNEKMR